MFRTLLTPSVTIAFMLGATFPTFAQEAETLAAGKALVTDNCGTCHAVDVSDASTHADAPAFRTLNENYPVADLAEALAEGIMSGHPDMPEFTFKVDEVDSIIAWLESIQKK